ncbi:unnamed protein product [Zymoseptoria tritici ST99CH_1A5]|uniref:Cytochrome c oxidase assembly protein n=3 Tax=Zymoseptoria tritici TaxID=1047171 RepID=A0A1X7RDX4_ZYMT9|nr:unnamed protein product [Zymoseptoria tritici ST99CH_3D7]SMR41801.1 unnamed protein product [Zymoseptoria tritici ST99CH_1E4]SMR43991.1 unnamed protein product [Zymoseptoria tritici ST99CH_3D1]SMY19148.1 unnamed protein product [Zymoseptoria tritici ST99CH_1A5]
MSTAAKATLACTTLGAIGIVLFVHRQQDLDKAAMHQGVIRDMEQQRVKRERQADFEMQRQLEEEYRKVQNVSNGTDGGGKAK